MNKKIKNIKRKLKLLSKQIKSHLLTTKREFNILKRSSFYLVFTNDYFNIFDDRYVGRQKSFGPIKIGQMWKYDLHDAVPELDTWVKSMSEAVLQIEDNYKKTVKKGRTNFKKKLNKKGKK